MNEIIINAICTLSGALGLKIYDSLFTTKKENKEHSTILIEKMQDQINQMYKRQDELQVQIDDMSRELDSWKDKYFKLLNKYYKILAKYLPDYIDPEHPNT